MLEACCAAASPLSITRRNGAWSSGWSFEARNSLARTLASSATMSSHLPRLQQKQQQHQQWQPRKKQGEVENAERPKEWCLATKYRRHHKRNHATRPCSHRAAANAPTNEDPKACELGV